ncbi:hypothetical protein LXL04_023052 [Taraxacum kok-saghyz]
MNPEQGNQLAPIENLESSNTNLEREGEIHQRHGKGVETSQPQEPNKNFRTSIMSDMMKLLEMAMTQQQETFVKMMADQNAVNHQFTVHGNPIGDSGRNQNANPINSQLNMVGQPPKKNPDFKGFLNSRPPEFNGDENPLKCLNWLRETEQAF